MDSHKRSVADSINDTILATDYILSVSVDALQFVQNACSFLLLMERLSRAGEANDLAEVANVCYAAGLLTSDVWLGVDQGVSYAEVVERFTKDQERGRNAGNSSNKFCDTDWPAAKEFIAERMKSTGCGLLRACGYTVAKYPSLGVGAQSLYDRYKQDEQL